MIVDFHCHLSVPGSFLPETDGQYYKTVLPVTQVGQILEHVTRDAVDMLSESWRTPAAIRTYRTVGPVIYTEMARRLMSADSGTLLSEMSQTGVTCSVVVAIDPYIPTAAIVDVCSQLGGLLLPFCSADTTAQDPCADLSKNLKHDIYGVKFHSDLQNIPIGCKLLDELLDVLSQSGKRFLPVYLHTGNFPIYRPSDIPWEQALPLLLERYPHLTFICGHSGWDAPKAAVRAALKHNNLYLETSWQRPRTIRRLCDILGPKRLLLGSDFPLYSQRRALKNAKSALSAAEFECVSYSNAAKLLRL